MNWDLACLGVSRLMKDVVTAHLNNFLHSFTDEGYPQPLLSAYEPIECLSHHQYEETLLVRQKQSEDLYVVKCYSDHALIPHLTKARFCKSSITRRCPPSMRNTTMRICSAWSGIRPRRASE